MIEYIRSGGEDLMDEEEILTKLKNWMCIFCYARKLKCRIRKFKARKPNARRKMTSNNNHESMACRIHDRAHLWKDCPDNKFNKQKNTRRRK
jgi:hypothetical protein